MNMRMQLKKHLCALLALCVCCLGLGAPALAEEASGATLTMMGLDEDSSGRMWESNLFFTRMAEQTGVSFTFEQYSTASDYQKEVQKLSSRSEDKLPDVLFKAALDEQTQRRYAADGTLIDLAPLLETYAPNLFALLEANPEWRKQITLPDGKIVALPLINPMEHQVGIWINQSWLATLGVSMPTDADSLYEALMAIKNGDPNRNGNADEIPLNMTGVWELRWLLGFFGIVADDYNLSMQGGEVTFAPRMEGYREFVEYAKRLFDNGLLPETAFRDLHALAALEDKESDTLVSGAILSLTPYSQVEADKVTQYGLILPESGTWRDLLGEVWGGTFAITKGCEDVESALAWVDALYADNATLAYAGVEGVDYTMSENGWTWILDTYRTVDTIRAESIIYTSGTMPGLVPAAFMHRADSELDRHVTANSDALQVISTRPLPARILTDEEEARVNVLQDALGTAVDVGIARFVTGEVELNDETWQAYQDELTSLGADELVEIFAQIVKR